MIEWNKVTWYSTSLSVAFFIFVLPAIIFYIGLRYKQVTSIYEESQEIIQGSIENLAEHKAVMGEIASTTIDMIPASSSSQSGD